MTTSLDRDFESVLTAARTGDHSALGGLLERVRPQLERMAITAVATWPCLRGREADVVQETLTDAIRAFDRFIGVTETGWLHWLKRILENNVTDMGRHDGAKKRDQSKEQRLDTSLLAALSDGGETPSKTAARDEDVARVRRALSELSQSEQLVIRLRD